MGLHDDIAAGLADLRAFAGFDVEYNDGQGWFPVTASPGSTPLEQVIDDLGTVVRTAGWDWLVEVAELVRDEIRITPRAGHLVRYAGTEYEVRPIGSEPCFAYSDALGTQYRIHTKQRAGQ